MVSRLAPKAMATKLVRVLRLQHPDYHYLKKVFQYTREILEVGPAPPRKRLPALLTEAELVAFYDKHGQSILYTSAEISDCIPQRAGKPLRCLHKFEEPQLLHGNGSLPQTPHEFGAIDDQGFVRRQRNQGALW